ncbi:MAG: T9SS type A sorting domain-containing protein, partial [Calditrichota bacterium]
SNDQTGLALYSSSGEVIGNIIAQNGQDGIYAQEAQATWDYNDVWLNQRDNYRGVAAGQNDISENPQLDQDLTPMEGSPVIDAGSRILRDPDGTRSDIGARFFNQNHPPVITSFSPEDFNRAKGDREIPFHVEASDEDGHQIYFNWFLNDDRLGAGANFANTFRRDGHYRVRVEADDRFYLGISSHTWEFDIYGCGVEDEENGQPFIYQLQGPYPNPFNSATRISLSIPVQSEVSVTLWDVQGRLESVLVNSSLPAGRKEWTINAADLGSGVHVLKVNCNGHCDLRKLVVLE